MKIQIREYQPADRQVVVKFMEDLQDYLVRIDGDQRMRRMPGYGRSYTAGLLKKVSGMDGVIYLAECDKKPVGLVAAIVHKQTKEDLLEVISSKDGRVQELIVDSRYKGQGIGRMLMEKAEHYLKHKGCRVARVEVFAPNVNAHEFYLKLGYRDRIVDMMKEL